jgi:hypothetical protein
VQRLMFLLVFLVPRRHFYFRTACDLSVLLFVRLIFCAFFCSYSCHHVNDDRTILFLIPVLTRQ